jgi:hypothetical protein
LGRKNVFFILGHRKERKRGSGTPPVESEEWDYEEGHSPSTPEVKDQQSSTRYNAYSDEHSYLSCFTPYAMANE